jgi:hypothetical protein
MQWLLWQKLVAQKLSDQLKKHYEFLGKKRDATPID